MTKFLTNRAEVEFKKILNINLAVYIVVGLIGITMIFLPNVSTRVMGCIIGIILLINAFNTLYKYLKKDGAKLYSYNLVFSIIEGVLGIVMILLPNLFGNLITVGLGLYLIVVGSNLMTYGIWFKVGSHPSWLITVVTGLLLILFGIMVIINPFAKLTITQLCGTFILLSSILEVTNVIMLKNKVDKIVSIFW